MRVGASLNHDPRWRAHVEEYAWRESRPCTKRISTSFDFEFANFSWDEDVPLGTVDFEDSLASRIVAAIRELFRIGWRGRVA